LHRHSSARLSARLAQQPALRKQSEASDVTVDNRSQKHPGRLPEDVSLTGSLVDSELLIAENTQKNIIAEEDDLISHSAISQSAASSIGGASSSAAVSVSKFPFQRMMNQNVHTANQRNNAGIHHGNLARDQGEHGLSSNLSAHQGGASPPLLGPAKNCERGAGRQPPPWAFVPPRRPASLSSTAGSVGGLSFIFLSRREYIQK